MLHRLSKGVSESSYLRMDEGGEEATKLDRDKGMAQSSTYRYPDGGVVKNPPADAGDT